jgi:ADP-ribose pyrophosphatase
MDSEQFFEKTIAKRVIHKGKLITIREDVVKSVKGQFNREIVEHPGAVAIIPIIGKDIVVIKQYRHAIERAIFELPAGTLEKEESPEECARRELLEETGYTGSSFKKILELYPAPGYSTEVIYLYLATNLTKTKQRPEKDEHIKVLTIDLETVLQMIGRKEIKDAKSIIGILYLKNFVIPNHQCHRQNT